MKVSNPQLFHLRARDSGTLEIPADVMRRIGLGPGDRVVVSLEGETLEVGRAKSRKDDSQFVPWRSISHELLAEPGAA